MSDTPRTDALADRFGDIDPDSPYWEALALATDFERELNAKPQYVHGLAGGECAACGFRYFEHKGHIIPCPRCEAERLREWLATYHPDLIDKFDSRTRISPLPAKETP